MYARSAAFWQRTYSAQTIFQNQQKNKFDPLKFSLYRIIDEQRNTNGLSMVEIDRSSETSGHARMTRWLKHHTTTLTYLLHILFRDPSLLLYLQMIHLEFSGADCLQMGIMMMMST